MLWNLHKKSWTEGLSLAEYEQHCKMNEQSVRNMLDLAKTYNKASCTIITDLSFIIFINKPLLLPHLTLAGSRRRREDDTGATGSKERWSSGSQTPLGRGGGRFDDFQHRPVSWRYALHCGFPIILSASLVSKMKANKTTCVSHCLPKISQYKNIKKKGLIIFPTNGLKAYFYTIKMPAIVLIDPSSNAMNVYSLVG